MAARQPSSAPSRRQACPILRRPPGADPERVRGEMLAMLDEGHRAFIYSNATLRRESLNVFDSTFAITYAL